MYIYPPRLSHQNHPITTDKTFEDKRKWVLNYKTLIHSRHPLAHINVKVLDVLIGTVGGWGGGGGGGVVFILLSVFVFNYLFLLSFITCSKKVGGQLHFLYVN